MEIRLKRIANGKTYTTGKLYITPNNKPDVYFCDPLEPAWRNLLGVAPGKEEKNLHFSYFNSCFILLAAFMAAALAAALAAIALAAFR